MVNGELQRTAMDNLEVYLVIELAINLGRFEDLKALMADMVEATQKNEVGLEAIPQGFTRLESV